MVRRFWAHFTNTKDGSFKKWAAKLTALAQIFLSFANTCGVFLYLLHNKTTTFTNPLYGGIAEAAIPWHPHGGPMTCVMFGCSHQPPPHTLVPWTFG